MSIDPKNLGFNISTSQNSIQKTIEEAKKAIENAKHKLSDPRIDFQDWLKDLIGTLNTDKRLAKTFLTAINDKKELLKGHPIQDINAIQKIFENQILEERRATLYTAFEKLSEKFIRIEEKTKAIHRYPYLVGIKYKDLQARWHESFEALQRTIETLNELSKITKLEKDEIKNLEKIQNQLKVSWLHYLVRGAKIPLLDPAQPENLPFIEFYENNEALYYRGDGGAIIDIYFEAFFDKFPLLKKNFTSKKDLQELTGKGFIGLVNKARFRDILKKCCKFFSFEHFEYRSISNISDISSIQFKSEKTIFDFTFNFDDFRTIKDLISNLLAQFSILSASLVSTSSLIIGAADDHDIYFFLPIGGSWNENTLKFLEHFHCYQNVHGVYPEIMTVKEALVKLNYNLQKLENIYPFKDNMKKPKPSNSKSEEATKEENPGYEKASKELEDAFKSLEKKLSLFLTRNYFSIAYKLWKFLKRKTVILQHPSINKILSKRITRMQKIISQIETIEETQTNTELKFQECLQQFYLLFDELTTYSSFLIINPNEVRNSLPKGLKLEGVQFQDFTYTSGMSCFGAITDAIFDYNKSSSPMEIRFEEGCYYELTHVKGGLKDYITKDYNWDRFSLDSPHFEEKCKNWDVIFTDLYPNFVTLDVVREIPLKELIDKAMEKRDKSKPLFVVLDTSTTIFFDCSVEEYIKSLHSYLQDGTLALFIVNSLAKFTMNGLDKYTGGIVRFYYNSGRFEKIAESLNTTSQKDPFSDQSQWFFYFLFNECVDEIKTYVERIGKNTNDLYKGLAELRKKEKDTYIRIGERSEKIPMMGLHFGNIISKVNANNAEQPTDNQKSNLTLIMQYYFYAKFAAERWPISLRSSFGFPTTNFIECGTALRLTAGDEEESTREKYIDKIKKINVEIGKALDQSTSEWKNAFNYLINLTDMKNFINSRQIEIIRMIQKTDFHNFILQMQEKLAKNSKIQ